MTTLTGGDINSRAFLAQSTFAQFSENSQSTNLSIQSGGDGGPSVSIEVSESARQAILQSEMTLQSMRRFNESIKAGPEPKPLDVTDVIEGIERLLGLEPEEDNPQRGKKLGQAINSQANEAFGAFQNGIRQSGAFAFSEVSFSARIDQIDFALETPNGSIDFSYTSIQFTFEARQVSGNFGLIQADPLILDLGGDGVTTTSVQDGLNFDLDADGKTDRIAGIGGNDAFLVLDRNGNGKIDNGKELFGDQHGAKDGIEELLKFDRNNDQIINALDPVFADLKLMDRKGRLSSLKDQGITQIRLDQVIYDEKEHIGGTETASFTFDRENGKQGQGVEIFLNMLA